MKQRFLTKEQYQKIYYEDYYKLKRDGISFKFREKKTGWFKLYYKKNDYLGYRYFDSAIYSKPLLIDTFRKEGYEDLLKLMGKVISWNSVRYSLPNYTPNDLKQFQCEIILMKIEKFEPQKKAKIHTFLSTCLKNGIIDEIRKLNSSKRRPTAYKTKERFSIISLDDENNKFVISKIGDEDKIFKYATDNYDLEKILSIEKDKFDKAINTIRRILITDCSVYEAANVEGISVDDFVIRTKVLNNNMELKGLLKGRV